jgi:hypothetical protein
MKKKEVAKKQECPWSSNTPQICKCIGYFLKSYAGVGIALALFMLVGLQIEQQYRSQRYVANCLNHLTGPEIKLSEQEKNFACANIYRESPALFEYYRGNVVQFMPLGSFK